VNLGLQIVSLFVLAIPIASIAWTVTYEEIFREAQDYCKLRSREARHPLKRKLFYALTCNYCFSHYVTIAMLAITRYKLLYDDWRGYMIAGFALVWVANQYMSLYAMLRQDYKKASYEAKALEHEVKVRTGDSSPQIHHPAA
jgi:hypothetical protein